MNQIYLNINDQQAGPYEVEAVNQMLLTNEISLETLAWKQGMDNWESLTCDTFKLLGVAPASTNQSSSLSPNGGNITQTNQILGQKEKSLKQSFGSAKSGTFQIGQALSEAFSFFKDNMIGSMAWLIMAILIGAIPLANLIVPLMGVNFYTCVRNYRESGQKMSFGELFNFDDALDKIIGPIVVGILIAAGFICLIIPGIILTLMWSFTPCIQGDRAELSFIQAMKESKRVANGNYIKIFLLLIILVILAFSGFLLLGIGALVTLPVAHIALYCAYDQCKDS